MRLQTGKEIVLIVPDLQIPFHHRDSFTFLANVKEEYQPTKVVCIGDSLDCHALSRWVANPDGYSAGHEHGLAIKYLEEFYDIFPEGVEVASNHNIRAWKRAFEAGIPSAFIKSYAEAVKAPDSWKFVDSVTIDDVIYEHGDSYQGEYAAKTAAKTNMHSTVIGHHHTNGSIHYVANNEKLIWGMNVGCLIDKNAYAFEYAKKYKSKPTLSCGIVYKGVPKLIPFITTKRDRWVGEII